MENWKEAEADGSRSIEMGNESSIKHDRRGQARYNLGNYEEALEDFMRAKALDSNTKSVDQNIEYCKERITSEKEKTENNPKKAEDVAADEVAVPESKNGHDSSSSDSEDERNIFVKNNKINENIEADLKTKTDIIKISPQNSGPSKDEKTDEELEREIKADKKELDRRIQTKLDQKAKEEMIELIRENKVNKVKEEMKKAKEEMIELIRGKIFEEERLKLMQENLALRDMVERYEDEEKRKRHERDMVEKYEDEEKIGEKLCSNLSATYKKPSNGIHNLDYLSSQNQTLRNQMTPAAKLNSKIPLQRAHSKSKVDSWNLNYQPRSWQSFIMSVMLHVSDFWGQLWYDLGPKMSQTLFFFSIAPDFRL